MAEPRAALTIKGRQPIRPLAKGVIGSVVFGVGALGAQGNGETDGAIVMLTMSVVLLAAGSADAWRRRRLVVADAHGLTVRDLSGLRQIPWSAIEDFRVGRISTVVAVYVVLRGRGEVLALDATMRQAWPKAVSEAQRQARELQAWLLHSRAGAAG